MILEKALIKAMKLVFGNDGKRIEHALLTPDGQFYHFLETDKAKEVIYTDKYYNKSVEIIGKVFHNTNVLELEGIKIK